MNAYRFFSDDENDSRYTMEIREMTASITQNRKSLYCDSMNAHTSDAITSSITTALNQRQPLPVIIASYPVLPCLFFVIAAYDRSRCLVGSRKGWSSTARILCIFVGSWILVGSGYFSSIRPYDSDHRWERFVHLPCAFTDHPAGTAAVAAALLGAVR